MPVNHTRSRSISLEARIARALSGSALGAVLAGSAAAQPVVQTVASGSGAPTSTAAAPLNGLVAWGDQSADRIEVRTTTGTPQRAVERAQVAALLPWMAMEGPDGPASIALSDTGRLAFIAVWADAAAPDGQPNDAILRLEVDTGDLRVFTRIDLGSPTGGEPAPALAHFRGRLYVGTPGQTRVIGAGANALTGSVFITSPTPATALAIDRDAGMVIGLSNGTLVRAAAGQASLAFAPIAVSGLPAGIADIAWSDHFGGPSQGGLSGGGLLVRSRAAGDDALHIIPAVVARGQVSGAADAYVNSIQAVLGREVRAISATADGAILAASGGDVITLREASDPRLGYEAWALDEFRQVVRFAKGLVSPDGEPAGWVIDADVQQGWTRFHPATADAAGWTVLLCLMSHELTGDPDARAIVRSILTRYAGLAPDGIRPLRSADGIYWHWLDPFTGGAKAGWGDSYATLSTMKIVLAAARAAAHFPQDPEIREAARAIICGIRNWDAYFASTTARPIYFLGQAAGGPNTSSASNPYNEGILLAAQAAFYGGPGGQAAYARWLDRNALPFGVWLSGRPITGGAFGQFQPAFVSLYALLTDPLVRASPSWQEHYRNLRHAHAAWTDDNGPRLHTVFSAGTTRADWGGYSADSLSNHPGDVTTLTALLAFTGETGISAPRTAEAVGAYQAYRRGARQTFLGGASILYRRSNVDPSYQPNSAGLPDVAMGALGLAGLIRPGSIEAVLAAPFPACAALSCGADFNLDGSLDPDDLADFIACYFTQPPCPAADLTGDGTIDPDDLADYIAAYFAGCP